MSAIINDDWIGQRVAILATGPSILDCNLDYFKGMKVIAVNDAYRLYPNADIMYAADSAWWENHDYCKEFGGERWTQNRGGSLWQSRAEEEGLRVVASVNGKGLSEDNKVIHAGYNSGFQALNIAYLMGANEIYLAGFDCCISGGKRHFFGDHEGKLNKNSPYNLFINAFQSAKDQLLLKSVKVFNCCKISKITCFPFIDTNNGLNE